MQFDVVIVSWNVREQLTSCLKSLQVYAPEAEVVVVDNASTDGSADMVTQSFPDVSLIRNSTNVGFARANNQGLRQSSSPVCVLLNPDTRITEGSLQVLVQYLEKHPAVGIVGPQLHNPDGSIQPSVRSFPTFTDQALILLKLHRLMPNALPLRRYFRKDFTYTREQPVEQVMGACLAFLRTRIDRIGYLDPGYRIWFEEVDFCKRIHDAGLSVYYLPEAKIMHEKAASFTQLRAFREQQIFLKSALRYFRRHRPQWEWVLLVALSPLSLLLAAGVGILELLGMRFSHT